MHKKLWGIVSAFVLLFTVNTIYGATAHDWIVGQQYPSGLVDSYQQDNSTVAYTYDQACAIVALTCENDLTRAKKILDKMVAIQNAEGSWDNAYYGDTAQPTSTWRRAGESLWMIIAINYYTRKTGDTNYVNAAKKCADWILTLQETNPADPRYGSIYGGLTDTGARETWTSTEHNHDAYSALTYIGEILNNQYYKDKANLVYNWLVTKMWDNVAGRFYTGHNDYSEYLDPQSWSVASLGLTGTGGQDFKRAISWAYNKMHLTRTYNSQTIDGFDYDGTITPPGGGVWFEGTEQMVLAYELIGDATKANYFHSQTAKVQSTNGGIICATGDGGYYWPTNFPYNCLAATSWYIFCSQTPRVNPFKPPLGTPPDTTPPIISNVISSNITSNSSTITWTTNETSDSQVEYGLTTAYGNSTTLDTNLVLNHNVNLTGLTSNTLYHYRVKSKDAAGNLATSVDFAFTTSTGTIPGTKNYAPTSVTVIQGTGLGSYTDLSADDNIFYSVNAMQSGPLFYTDWNVKTNIAEAPANVTKITLTWKGHYTANQWQGLFLYNFVTSVWARLDYQVVGTIEQAVTFSTTDITSYISSSGQISLRIYTERTDNVACYTDYINFAVELNGSGDTTPPQISSVQSSNISTSSATISWTTNETSDSQVEYGLTTSYGNNSLLNTNLVLNHTVTLTGLSSGTTYYYRVKSKDAAGNLATSANYIFSTAPADITPPVISNINSANVTVNSCTINWTTNENSDSQVEYGLTTSYGSSSTLDTNLVLNHTVNLTGLSSGTIYHYRVKSKDAAGNLAVSADYTFTTQQVLTKDYYTTGVVITKGSSSANYSNLISNNGVYMTVGAVRSGSKYIIDWYAKTQISESRSQIAKFTITYDGRYSNTQSQGLFLYNFVTNVWARIDYQNIGTTDKTIIYPSTDIASYISSSGEIRLRLYTSSTKNHTCYADFIRFNIELINNPSPTIINTIYTAAPLGAGQVKLYNNLFNPLKSEQTRIDYTIDTGGQVVIKIYNLVGELVKTLLDENKTAGSYTEYWNGKNDDGEIVSSGIYLFYIEAPGIKTIKKAAVIK